MPEEPTRKPDELAELIDRELSDAPDWLDLSDDPDTAVAYLLDEGRGHHVPRDLLWEYAASRWTELFEPPDER